MVKASKRNCLSEWSYIGFIRKDFKIAMRTSEQVPQGNQEERSNKRYEDNVASNREYQEETEIAKKKKIKWKF